ncbi:ABC-three component system protein [Streptomyces sp. NPDC052107]|uniref:ABC-three component system protein n=1 Tax=Streptomyces TaxID=1883 RepID=UPI00342D5A25
MSYLEPAYRELGVILNDQVRRRFDEVKAFHHSVVRNRRRFLEEEIQELTDRLAARRQERADLGKDQARLLRELAGRWSAGSADRPADSPWSGGGRSRCSSPPLRRSASPRSQRPPDHHQER